MRKDIMICIAVTVTIVSVVATWLVNRSSSTKQNLRQAEAKPQTNYTSAASLESSSLETMISSLPTVFDCARSRPVRFGDGICWRIHALTNRSEQASLVRSYSEMLLSLPLDEGGYRKREAAMDNVWEMAVHWGDVMYRLHVSPEFHMNFLVSLLGRYRKALECGLSAHPDDVEYSTSDEREEKLSEDSLQMCEFMRFPAWPPVGGAGLGRPSRDSYRIRERFVVYATKIFPSNVRVCREYFIPSILERVPPKERKIFEKKANAAFTVLSAEFSKNVLAPPPKKGNGEWCAKQAR